jgi:hypothetical protein
MTPTGAHRARYSTEVEPRPSRFTGGTEYAKWAKGADAWVPLRKAAKITPGRTGYVDGDGLTKGRVCGVGELWERVGGLL